MTASTRRRSGRFISTTAARSRRWSISLTAPIASSPANCRSKKPWRWSGTDAAPRAAISITFRTRWPISPRWACVIASSRSWRDFLCAQRAAVEHGAGDEAQLVARLFDRQAEPLAQHHPALRRQRHGERVQGALARLARQGRQLMLEPAGELG